MVDRADQFLFWLHKAMGSAVMPGLVRLIFILALVATAALWFGVTLLFWSAFEYCLQAGENPYRIPPHHFWWGMLGAVLGWFILVYTLVYLVGKLEWLRIKYDLDKELL